MTSKDVRSTWKHARPGEGGSRQWGIYTPKSAGRRTRRCGQRIPHKMMRVDPRTHDVKRRQIDVETRAAGRRRVEAVGDLHAEVSGTTDSPLRAADPSQNDARR